MRGGGDLGGGERGEVEDDFNQLERPLKHSLCQAISLWVEFLIPQ